MQNTDMSFTYFLFFNYKSEDQRDHSIDDGILSVSFHNRLVISLDFSGRRDYFIPETVHSNIMHIDFGTIFK